ncbi:MAG: LysM peptidoglycan-binding domain-containing protein [Eubacteriales bacterium]|nr:LysM peptidoglycan-binding domain-containing protein [Eubacteriales bacterium]
MAKTPHASLSRIAATVTARYFPGSGVTDNYYLDGRLTSRREHRAADTTLDREDRGLFYAAFAHQTGHGPDEVMATRVHKSLERILTDVKQNVRNIDAEINELAECAVDIAGRITLQHENIRQPYFAGVMIKDAELAAITMGHGCAYLYRNDALYPLTHDDVNLEAVDFHGKPVPGQDIYCAGVAGTVRYSNIAQLQPDDCILVCNKEVITTLGQREILRLLYEAEDQADAAGLIITAASAKLPGIPMQVIACFVESLKQVEKTVRPATNRTTQDASLLGRLGQVGKAGAAAAIKQEDHAPVPMHNAPALEEDEVSPYDRGYFEKPRDEGGRIRRLALYMVITAVTIGAVFAIFNMIFGKSGGPAVTEPTEIVESLDEETAETTPVASESIIEETTETTIEETTAAPTETTVAAGEISHTVKSGDTLYSIAVQYLGSGSLDTIKKIKDYNNIKSDSLSVGQVIKIPPKG